MAPTCFVKLATENPLLEAWRGRHGERALARHYAEPAEVTIPQWDGINDCLYVYERGSR